MRRLDKWKAIFYAFSHTYLYKKHKKAILSVYSFQNIPYFCAVLRIIIQKDEKES